jgi:hypothetical protein
MLYGVFQSSITRCISTLTLRDCLRGIKGPRRKLREHNIDATTAGLLLPSRRHEVGTTTVIGVAKFWFSSSQNRRLRVRLEGEHVFVLLSWMIKEHVRVHIPLSRSEIDAWVYWRPPSPVRILYSTTPWLIQNASLLKLQGHVWAMGPSADGSAALSGKYYFPFGCSVLTHIRE